MRRSITSQYATLYENVYSTISCNLVSRCVCSGDEIQFTTLPQPLQTSVIRETHISGPTAVTRVIRENGGVYAVTVRENEETRVVYVNESGTIVQAPSSTTTTTTTEPTEEQVVTYDCQSSYSTIQAVRLPLVCWGVPSGGNSRISMN